MNTLEKFQKISVLNWDLYKPSEFIKSWTLEHSERMDTKETSLLVARIMWLPKTDLFKLELREGPEYTETELLTK